MQSKLDVTLSHNAQMSDDFDGTIPQHLKFLISECLAWSHYNRISCCHKVAEKENEKLLSGR